MHAKHNILSVGVCVSAISQNVKWSLSLRVCHTLCHRLHRVWPFSVEQQASGWHVKANSWTPTFISTEHVTPVIWIQNLNVFNLKIGPWRLPLLSETKPISKQINEKPSKPSSEDFKEVWCAISLHEHLAQWEQCCHWWQLVRWWACWLWSHWLPLDTGGESGCWLVGLVMLLGCFSTEALKKKHL